jgi:hypothetical protein
MIVAICWPRPRRMSHEDALFLDNWFAEHQPRPPEEFDIVVTNDADPVRLWAKRCGYPVRTLHPPVDVHHQLGGIRRDRALADECDVFIYWRTPATPRAALEWAFTRRNSGAAIELVPVTGVAV